MGMADQTNLNAPDADLTAGFAAPGPARELTIEERIAALENSVNLLNAHAAQLQGKIGLLGVEMAIDVLTRIRSTPDPAETLRVYLDVAQKNGRKIKAPPDNPYHDAIQAGIDGALAEHIEFLLRYSSDLPGLARPQA
jgi:hypothetical protein